ncbi:hypothetical protein [uncultured Cytophaga sp.]|uniref:hypothetical protein n=1 Tax=uncultured Cytophaga sp. TaxID=160238 RepID=UPI0026299A2A|nr:hypothetical protein [uncultured Cytophaga sp.]
MDTTTLKREIKDILKKQKHKKQQTVVDVLLYNGNLMLKSFRIYEYNVSTCLIKGMTMHEEYAYLRENRKPIFAYFHLDEINTIEITNSDYLFLSKPILNLSSMF